MFGDMEMVRNAQQDAPTFRRVSLDLSQSQQQRANPLRRLSTSSSISSTSSVSQASSPTFSSSVPTSHTFWPAGDKVSGLSGLFRSGSTQLPQPQQLSPIQGTPDVKVPALIRSLSKGMDAFR